jgi:hypothetical protein
MLQVNSRQLKRNPEDKTTEEFLERLDRNKRERFTSQETRRTARYDPRVPHREREIGPLRETALAVARERYYDGLTNVQSPTHRSSRPQHHNRQRKPQEKPFRPQDPYAFPSDMGRSPIPPIVSGVKYAAKWIGLLDRQDDDSSSSSRASRDSKGKGKAKAGNEEEHPLKERIQTSLGLSERPKPSRRASKPKLVTRPVPATGEPSGSQRAGEAQSPLDEVAHELDKKDMQERLAFLEEQEKGRTKQEEEIGGIIHEPGLPAPHGTLPRHVHGGSTTTFESAPGGALPTETKPVDEKTQPETTKSQASKGRGIEVGGHHRSATLSPPKASPANHPASDPVSPTKRPSPFSLRGMLPDLNVIKGPSHLWGCLNGSLFGLSIRRTTKTRTRSDH